jgi:hypothetical protein
MFARLLAWTILEDHDISTLPEHLPAIDTLVERCASALTQADGPTTPEDAPVLAAAIMSVDLGWRLYGNCFLQMMNSHKRSKEFEQLMLGLIDQLPTIFFNSREENVAPPTTKGGTDGAQKQGGV